MTNLDALKALHRIRQYLLCVDQQLDVLTYPKENSMDPIDPKLAQIVSGIDAAANAIAARMQSLVDKANSAGSLTADEVEAALRPEINRLQAMGSDPTAPTQGAL